MLTCSIMFLKIEQKLNEKFDEKITKIHCITLKHSIML